jgi:hypothetical protein
LSIAQLSTKIENMARTKKKSKVTLEKIVIDAEHEIGRLERLMHNENPIFWLEDLLQRVKLSSGKEKKKLTKLFKILDAQLVYILGLDISMQRVAAEVLYKVSQARLRRAGTV